MASSLSLNSDRAMEDEAVMQSLITMFGDVLDLEIIQAVALYCQFNEDKATQSLLEISHGIKQEKVSSPHKQNTYSATSTNLADDADVIVMSESVINNPPNKLTRSEIRSVPQKGMIPIVSSRRKSKKEQELHRIVQYIRQGSRILVIMRGLPGSGKSYLAREIVEKGIGSKDYATFILSTDDFFINKRTKKYEYDFGKLTQAHEWNHQRAYFAMSNFISPVIIDNTNLQAWEMKPYVMLAVNFGYRLEIVEPFTHWALNDKELARRNTHGVPRIKIKEMLERYEKNLTASNLLAMWNLSYSPYTPLSRSYPPIEYVNNENKAANTVVVSSSETEENLMDFEEISSVQPKNDSTVRSDQSTRCHSNPMDSVIDINLNNLNILEPNVWNLPKESFSQNNSYVLKENASCSTEESSCIAEKSSRQSGIDHEDLSSHATLKTSFQPSVSQSEPKQKKNCTADMKNSSLVHNLSKPSAQQISQVRNLYPKLNLSSWGLPENAVSSWQSWDIVSPLNWSETPDVTDLPEVCSSTVIHTVNSATNTSSADFAMLSLNRPEGVSVLQAQGRNINDGIIINPPLSPPKKTRLDKSSMTNEDVLTAALTRERDLNDEKQIQQLIAFFPDKPIESLQDVYEKCKGDLNWAVDLLLDDKKEIPVTATVSSTPSDCEAQINRKNDNVPIDIQPIQVLDKKNSTTYQKQSADAIKRFFEENIEINSEYYSPHVLKIKNHRHGIASKPSSSKPTDFVAYSTPVDDVSDEVNLNDFEANIDFLNEEEEMVELNLGEDVVLQLENKFGFPDTFPRGFQPIIQVPVSLARQLHALYIESVLVQMENQNQVLEMIEKEDEELAKKLQVQEQEGNIDTTRVTPVPDLQEIMDEQMATNIYQKEIQKWKELTPDNLAIRLTRQKLFAAFPTIDKESLLEILHAHNNSYKDTVEVLLASADDQDVVDPDGTLMEPPLQESVIIEMKRADEETKASLNAPDVPRTANQYREEASAHLQKHRELIQKAQDAYRSKQYQVAQFYSDLAKTYTRLYDQANNLAASAFLSEHSQRLQKFSTLDLHYLYVKEAVAALDMFIDTNIRLLQGANKKCENLFIITGRGKRSDQGKSRIKPAVINRLRKRNIWFIEVNPGLLKIRVNPHSPVTSILS